MTKRFKQKYKICKQVGHDLWAKFYKNIDYTIRPGQHGYLKKKIKDYGFIFNNTKKEKIDSFIKKNTINELKKYYSHVNKKQFNSLYNKKNILTYNEKINPYKKSLISLLEQRIDVILYRLNWASTLFMSRQLINHGHLLINGNIITTPSRILHIGDKIEINKKSFSLIKQLIINNIEHNKFIINCPNYLEVNYSLLSAILINNPIEITIPYPTLKTINI